ncbi:D-alanyl-D-alanine carboxypeptidase [Methylosinus sporium]|uniref:serine-type D-Ala-D-Ala carboxypeptidase n=1 Tax=Methylosinus sporium TaxID=428 RepID=A0A549SFS4_METSR|nr:D-alanyl-D-alanine carboxypeptidase family protein [Methylosinus sporium]TRL28488.1 D-alanyl-D-alanine carboxypeptidase [Methylosinus sporium]
MPVSLPKSLIRLGFVAAALAIAPAAALAQGFQTSAPHAILVDAGTRTLLLEKGADDYVTPASTVKIMTAEIVFREIAEGRLKLDDEFTVSEHAWRSGGAPAGGSAMFLAVNSRPRVEDLIRGLVIDSGNDAAITLAEGVAGSEEAFVGRMNKRASELGLTKSVFGNPWGKAGPDQKVTPREMVQLSAHVIKTYPDLYRYFGEKEFTWNKIKQQNRNPLLTMSLGADGLKTGNIDDSGFGMVGSAVQDDRRLIVAVYGLRTAKDRAEEARKLLQWGFRNFEEKALFKAGETVGTAQVYGGTAGTVPLTSPNDIKVLLQRGGSEKLSGKIVYEGPLIAPIEAGTKVAKLEVRRGSTLVLEQPLEAAETVEKGSLASRAFDAAYEYAAGAIHNKLSKKQ